MYNPTFQRFSSAYDHVDLVVEPATVSTPQISQPFIEDLRYWTAGTESIATDKPVFLRHDGMDGHIKAELNRDVDVETVQLPEPLLRELGLHDAPLVATFWIARPGHTEQLERFYV